MRAVQTNLRDFIEESKFFRIPDFQRPYAWHHLQGEAFWDSLHNTVTNNKNHYFGSIVFFEEDDNRVVIDGQQRLTTTLLFLTAVFHTLIDDSRKAWKITAEDLGKTYLYNEEDGELKVILRGATTDRSTFDRILKRKVLPIDEQSKLFDMYQYFINKINTIDKLDPYVEVLGRFDMISISLQSDDDDPQVIFENINATGEPLTDGDKIRNFALMLNTEKARNLVYKDYWLKIEKTLTRSGPYVGVGDQLISLFFRIFLTIKYNDKVVGDKNTYSKFKEYYRSSTPDQSLEQLHEVWQDITSVLEDYTYLIFKDDITPDKTLSVFDDDMRDTNDNFTETCIFAHLSFFIQLLEFYKQGDITRNDFRKILEVVRKQEIRDRTGRRGSLKLINITANAVFKVFKEYEMNSYYDAYLWYMDGAGDVSNSKNVSDEEIEHAITNEDIKDKWAKFVLRDIDGAHEGNFRLLTLGLDHIMPKAIHGFRLDDVWKEELGENWEVINQRFYGKLANMALVNYAISNNKNLSYFQKLSKPGGLGDTDARSTKWIADNFNNWNIEALEKRTKWLVREINRQYKIPKPILSEKIQEKFGRD